MISVSYIIFMYIYRQSVFYWQLPKAWVLVLLCLPYYLRCTMSGYYRVSSLRILAMMCPIVNLNSIYMCVCAHVVCGVTILSYDVLINLSDEITWMWPAFNPHTCMQRKDRIVRISLVTARNFMLAAAAETLIGRFNHVLVFTSKFFDIPSSNTSIFRTNHTMGTPLFDANSTQLDISAQVTTL